MQYFPRITLWVLFTVIVFGLSAQSHRKPGLTDNTPTVFAFTNAQIIVSADVQYKDATMIVRDGWIEDVGSDITIPADAWITDMTGKTIYPGFIDIYTNLGLPNAEQIAERDEKFPNGNHHWNPQVRSFYDGQSDYTHCEKQSTDLRSQGFVAAHIVPPTGVFRGYGSLVKLADDVSSQQILATGLTQNISFRMSRELGRGYPTSAMGAIALIRQCFYDAQWYKGAKQAWQKAPATVEGYEFNPALDALSNSMDKDIPFVFETEDEQWFLRAINVANEFGIQPVIKGSGYEYRRVEAIKQANIPIILPLNFPDKHGTDKPEKALNISLEDLRHWYLAPENPAILTSHNIPFALTSYGMEDAKQFHKNLRKAVTRGLPKNEALRALTQTPAQLLNISDRYGSLEKGKSACFFIASGNIFEEDSFIEQVWVQGEKHVVKENHSYLAGTWNVEIDDFGIAKMDIHNKDKGWEVNWRFEDEEPVKVSDFALKNQRISFTIEGDSLREGMRLSAFAGKDNLSGSAATDSQHFLSWIAQRSAAVSESEQQEGINNENEAATKDQKSYPAIPMLYPSMEYGIKEKPTQKSHILIRNATIWTQGPEDKLEDSDMLVEHGKIVRIGQNLEAPEGAHVIEAQGRHLTPGLIDPHLHTSIAGGVNETGDAITPETRITDVIDANNVWIYRLLAGGLTTGNLFHGSANPIGGQSAIFKMRWGSLAHELILENTKPGLKFALGENVKRSSDRYPDTRMGTREIIKDRFLAALQYEKEKKAAEESNNDKPFRKNLQLEAILEVLHGERLAHVHAYRQDEMLMMMRLAEKFDFTIASFEHTVEGYKIADELREHGAAAVIWTDWSSFKMEAYDAIHQNAKLLLDAGVHTSLHSDNTQLATRMNWEAGKVLKSGVSEIQAMNLITLYPAQILQIDDRVGSLEPGKDADFVLWNGHPLSAFTTADQTWIEGRLYFDRKQDQILQEDVIEQRNFLIQRIQSK